MNKYIYIANADKRVMNVRCMTRPVPPHHSDAIEQLHVLNEGLETPMNILTRYNGEDVLHEKMDQSLFEVLDGRVSTLCFRYSAPHKYFGASQYYVILENN